MGYYSFTALAKHPVGIPDPMIMLDTGFNVFTAFTNDLEGLLGVLKDEGVEVQQINCLDKHEPVTLQQSVLLPGEETVLGLPAGTLHFEETAEEDT